MRCGASPGSHPPSGLNGTSPSKCGAEIAVVAMAGAAAAPYIEAASRGDLVSLGSRPRRRATSFRKIEPNALPWHVSSQPVIERRSHGIAYADQCSPGAADALERAINRASRQSGSRRRPNASWRQAELIRAMPHSERVDDLEHGHPGKRHPLSACRPRSAGK